MGLLVSGVLFLNGCSIIFVQGSDGTLFLNQIATCRFEVGYRIAVTDTTAFVSDNSGVMIIDITNPVNPSIINDFNTGDTTFGVTLNGDVLFVATGTQGLFIVNVSSPEAPELLGHFTSSNIVNCFAIQGNYGFLGYLETPTVDVLNVTDLSSPALLTSISGYRCSDLYIHQDILFGACPSSGLIVYNVSNPASPSFIRSLSAPGASDISIGGDRLFLGCYQYGLKTFNITIPSAVSLLTTVPQDDDGEAQGVIYTEGFLCVADNYGVELFNITNPYSTIKIDEVRRGISAAHDIAAYGKFVFVAKGFGLGVFEISNTKRSYFPPYLYYVLPIIAVLIIGLGAFIFFRIKKKKSK